MLVATPEELDALLVAHCRNAVTELPRGVLGTATAADLLAALPAACRMSLPDITSSGPAMFSVLVSHGLLPAMPSRRGYSRPRRLPASPGRDPGQPRGEPALLLVCKIECGGQRRKRRLSGLHWARPGRDPGRAGEGRLVSGVQERQLVGAALGRRRIPWPSTSPTIPAGAASSSTGLPYSMLGDVKSRHHRTAPDNLDMG